MNTLENKIPPLLLVVLFILVMLGISPFLPTIKGGGSLSIGVSLISLVVGFFMVGAGVMEFRHKKTSVDPLEPEKASFLVVSGIYQISRNPMYVGFTFILVAVTSFLRSPLLIGCVALFVLYMSRFQIAPEEKAMSHRFGRDYDNYKSTVRRWL